MGDETDKKILDMLAMIDSDIHGLHKTATTSVASSNGFMRPEILIALLVPLISVIGVYVDINTRLVKIEEKAYQYTKESTRVHNVDEAMSIRIDKLNEDIRTLNDNVTELTAVNSQAHVSVSRRVRALEKKAGK